MGTARKRNVPHEERNDRDFCQHKMTAYKKKEEEIIKEAKAKKESKLKNRCL